MHNQLIRISIYINKIFFNYVQVFFQKNSMFFGKKLVFASNFQDNPVASFLELQLINFKTTAVRKIFYSFIAK